MCIQFPWPESKDNLKQDYGEMNRAYNFELEISGERNSTVSEDCLYLNIWNKPGGSRKKAVLVWIYGGGKLYFKVMLLFLTN
jgi:carboxylesterase type B